MTRWLLIPLLVAALPVCAADMKIEVEIPEMKVAEYHRPYLAVWVEREDSSVAANLAVWYQQERAQRRERTPRDGTAKAGQRVPGGDGGNGGGGGGGGGPGNGGGGGESGTKWLPDLRQWWRRSGRTTTVPIDGVTGATRPVGTHAIEFTSGQGPIAKLEPGRYRLVVEAAREVGGREVQKIPFQWPPAAAQDLSAQGKSELGRIALTLTP